MLAIDPIHYRVDFATENAVAVLEPPPSGKVCDQPLVEWLGAEVIHGIRNVEARPSLAAQRHLLGRIERANGACDLSAFSVADHLILEAVRATSDQEPSAIDVLKDVEVVTEALLSSPSSRDALNSFASLLRTMSGYHCIAIERDKDGKRDLVALAGQPDLSGAFCDGPRQMHAVADVNQPGIGLALSGTRDVPDLQLSTLRLPDARQLRALREHGVTAFATAGVWHGDHRWGTIKLLHGQPKHLNKRTHLALAHLLPLVGLVVQRMS